MEMEIQSLLEKLLDINDSMSRCAASAAPTTSVTQKLARHRDILHEFTQVIYSHTRSFHFPLVNGNGILLYSVAFLLRTLGRYGSYTRAYPFENLVL